MKFLKWSLILSSLGCLAACTSDDPIVDSDGDLLPKIQLAGHIDQLYQTRVVDNGFCNGDIIGAYIVDYNGEQPGTLKNKGNRADNVKHTFVEGQNKWESAYDIFFKDKNTPVDVYAYYPFTDVENVNSHSFEIQKDQSTSTTSESLGGYEASDFLWGKTEKAMPTQKVINISLRHILSSVRVTLAEGTGFAENEWEKVNKTLTLLNTQRFTTINLSNGEVSLIDKNEQASIIPYHEGNNYLAIVAPQTIAAQTKLFGISIDGKPYNFVKDETMTYLQGKQHNFTIKINKKIGSGYELVLTNESITPWENDPISHNAISREYVIVHVDKAGTLDKCITKAGLNISDVRNLKLTGKINSRDFAIMKYQMKVLTALNLKEVKIVAGQGGQLESEGKGYKDNYEDEIPNEALNEKESLTSLVLPDQLKYISALTSSETGAFANCKNLSGSLIVPEGVIEIGPASFINCTSLNGSLSLPSTLKRIGSDKGYISIYDGTFAGCGFTCELKIPDNVEVIGMGAFRNCENLYGGLILPPNLKALGESAFYNCKNLKGSLKIPQGVTTIPENCFEKCKLGGTLTLHDGIISIGAKAFKETGLKGELYLPKRLEVINHEVFESCDFSGRLVLPEGLKTIGDKCFKYNYRLEGTLEIPENVISIGAGAFAECRNLEGLIFPKDLENIRSNGGGAFADCFGINSIVCKGSIPAYVQPGAFDGVPKENFTLEVPESAIHLYQTEPGWMDFKRIAAHRELVIRPQVATAIKTAVTRDLVLNAEGDWMVESQPDWVKLDKTEGNGKTTLQLTFSQMNSSHSRKGEIVFMLKGKDYRTRCQLTQYPYGYDEDEWITLQEATKGQGVNIVFLGDGYNAKDVSEGKLLNDMKQAVEHYFSIEPYKTYRDYFNIYTAVSVSQESGVGTLNQIVYNRFGTSFKGGVNVSARDQDFTSIFNYAIDGKNKVTKDNIGQTLVVMVPNTEDYGGICYMWDDGSAIAYCPKSDYGYPTDWRGVIQHEAGGHGFGKLGDEYIYHNAFIDNCTCNCCQHVEALQAAFYKGWYANLSMTGKRSEVKWKHLLTHEKYKQIVDIFEGGFMHSRGVFRSEHNSCMNNEMPYFSTISREAIVKRIMQIAGEPYSFEQFVENDKIELPKESRLMRPLVDFSPAIQQHAAPVFMGAHPKL